MTTSSGKTAAVIGAGLGGLALAIRLQSAGIATTVFEKRDKPGGRAYVYHDAGFTFDAGPTVITDPDCLRKLWRLSGRDMADHVTLLPVDPFYRLCWEDGTVFDYADDQNAIERQIRAINPADVQGYRRFLAYSRDVSREGYEKLGTVPFLHFSDMIRAAPFYRDRILDYLEARYIPNLRRDLMTVRHFTPLDFRSELNAHLGSAFSVEPILTQSAWFRPHNRDDRLENLYVVGAGTHPGAGIPGVVGSAEATASLMIGERA